MNLTIPSEVPLANNETSTKPIPLAIQNRILIAKTKIENDQDKMNATLYDKIILEVDNL